jgi:hypothetical protein
MDSATATAADWTGMISGAGLAGCAEHAAVQRALAGHQNAGGGGEVNQSAAAFKVPANRLMAIRR